ncbi:MAG: DUF1638 domain-containing protein [Deferrisomatales bacterium]
MTGACPFDAVVACGSLEAEVAAVLRELRAPFPPRVLPHSLHATPGRLRARLEECLGELAGRLPAGSRVFLAFGECGGAFAGLASPTLALVRPGVPDCIPLALGSVEAHERLLREEPGTYFFTPAWIASGENPLSKYDENRRRYGEADARFVHDALYRHYRRFVYVAPQGRPDAEARAFTRRACEAFSVAYAERPGDLGLLRRYLTGLGEPAVVTPPAAGPVE